MLASDGGRSARPFVHDPAAYAILAGSLGLSPADLARELDDRSAFLESLAERGICDPPSVAAEVRAYPG
jgi:hypothetical protein